MSAPRLGRVPPRAFPGKPGRPRKLVSVAADPGHTLGTPAAEPRVNGGAPLRAPAGQAGALVALAPRLVDLPGAVAYLGRSPWVVRSFVASGRLTPVRIELPSGHVLRRQLFDVRDLDALVDSWVGR